MSFLSAKNKLLGAAPSPLYVDDVFSAYTYTGNGSTQTINNWIDLAGEGGLVWVKRRDGANGHHLVDTERGASYALETSSTAAQAASAMSGFTSSGFTLANNHGDANISGGSYISWTFRNAPKFFTHGTYVGDGVAGRQIPHDLGATPGMIVVKKVNNTSAWPVYHRSLGATKFLYLNTTDAQQTVSTLWNDTEPTTTHFTVGTAYNSVGATYVYYIFAHDPAEDGIIQCGSYTGNGSATGPVIDLGWEPQFLLVKRADSTGGDWYMFDAARGITMSADSILQAHNSNAESGGGQVLDPLAKGFQIKNTDVTINASGGTYIYLAIRRPNKPAAKLGAEKVFNAIARTGTGAAASVTGVGFAPDAVFIKGRSTGYNHVDFDRLRGPNKRLMFSATNAEATDTTAVTSFDMDGFTLGADGSTIGWNVSGTTFINWLLKRAPGFFDQVCYTGTGVAHAEKHNLGSVPGMIWVKSRSNAANWTVYHKALGATKFLLLNSTNAESSSVATWNNTEPTSTEFTVSPVNSAVDAAGNTFTAYLFGDDGVTCKAGSYVGNGAEAGPIIDLGFTPRFIIIKGTDANSAYSWFVFDSARGIVAAADPYLNLNSAAAEVSTGDLIDPVVNGFQIVETGPGLNFSGSTYIYWAAA